MPEAEAAVMNQACDHCKKVQPTSRLLDIYPPTANNPESENLPPALEVQSWTVCLDCAPAVVQALIAQAKAAGY